MQNEATGRFFLCAGCRVQVIVCSDCDRGQIYCHADCAQGARRLSLQMAGKRYQQSRIGRLKHARRTHNYRLRQQNVTHQGSPPPVPDDLLVSNLMPVTKSLPAVTGTCCFCGCPCSALVRQGFLGGRRVQVITGPDWRTPHHDHFP